MAARHAVAEGLQANGLCVIIGMEYATPEGDFLLFGPFETLPPGLSARMLLPHVANAGGVAIAAHPFRLNRQVQEGVIKNKLCRIVEGVNGRNTLQENERVLEWRDYKISRVGGSDAHSLEELGRVPTSFTVPVRSRVELIRALKEGSFKEVCTASSLAA
jgi:predicted metal-dependent phosphoesterase TrpH